MLFNSFEYILFLPAVFLLYWFVFKPLRWQNLLVVIASYLFYGWWDWRFLLLIAFTTLCSYGSGLAIEHYEGHRRVQRFISAANIVLNLGILGVFKYYNFFVDNLQAAFAVVGVQLDWPTLHVLLPVGISFYTFQALSYSIDVYRHKQQATRDIIAFFAFISFFPQLVAGPIERATNLLPQFLKSRQFDYARAVDGCRQMLWGFFKKIVIADTCATCVDEIWRNYEAQNSFTLFIGVLMFTIQIYCDFSGYSDIAIGTARLFGINLMRNFNFPYLSRSIPEFWRRWHISLMTWFQDYIYFPLGGSRCSKAKRVRNTLIVFGVSGLWHGANWTFICWGLYHALLFVPYVALGINTKRDDTLPHKRTIVYTLKALLQTGVTFLLAMGGWLIFRADSMTQAVDYFCRICTWEFFDFKAHCKLTSLVIAFFMLIVEYLQRHKQHGLEMDGQGIFRYAAVRYFIYILLIVLMVKFATGAQQFIYFQF